jgi:hypothetical protein
VAVVFGTADLRFIEAGEEVSPNFGDGLKDQAAAWA